MRIFKLLKRSRHSGIRCCIIMAALLVLLPSVRPAAALTTEEITAYWQNVYGDFTGDFQSLYRERLAKAAPDECYFFPGSEDNDFQWTGIDCDACMEAVGDSKVNQAYVWGLAKSGDTLWFGTGPNVLCLVFGGYMGMESSMENACYACEFGEGPYSPDPIPAAAGDWRPPRFFAYDMTDRSLTEKTPYGDPRVRQTLGLRSAGTLGDVVFLGGPALGEGINLFAFNTGTGAYLGSANLPAYSNIRRWLAVNGVLYTAVGKTGEGVVGGTFGGNNGGAVLKWTGNAADPFQFEEVGTLDSEGAELVYHEGRIMVSTWPGSGEVAGLFMSPAVPTGGLPASTEIWTKVWDFSEYEPDDLTARTYAGGAMASYGGYLYWGTMHVPMVSALFHFRTYSDLIEGYPANEADTLGGILGTYRPISIFRGKNFAGEPEVDLLYGMPRLPKFSCNPEDGSYGWELAETGMAPLYGPSGFGNFFNNYTWTMAAFDDQLFVGTMDWSILALYNFLSGDRETDRTAAAPLPDITELPAILGEDFSPEKFYGADLFRFPDANSPALPESIAGAGNFANYGIRTMISDDFLYLGTANPMNLLADLEGANLGGWELIKISPKGDLDGDGVVTATDLRILLSYLEQPATAAPYCDLDGDGLITNADAKILVADNPALARDRRLRRLIR